MEKLTVMKNVFELATDITPKRKIPDTKKILEAGKDSVAEFINEYLRQTPQFKLLITADNLDLLKTALCVLFKENSEGYSKSLSSPNVFIETEGEFKEVCYFVPPTKPEGVTRENASDTLPDYMKECEKNRTKIYKSIMADKPSLFLTQAHVEGKNLGMSVMKINPKEICFLPHVWIHVEERTNEYCFQLFRCFFAPSGTRWVVSKDKTND